MCLCECIPCLYMSPKGPEEGLEVTGSCEPTKAGSMNQTQILWKSSNHT